MIDTNNNILVNKILNFWFENKNDYNKWFFSNKYDRYITNNFNYILKDAQSGYLHYWLCNHKSYLALIILLDQFSRHIYRNSEKAFKNDRSALLFTEMGLDLHIHKLNAIEQTFALMPFQHSENIEDQKLGIKILENLIQNQKNLEEKNILKRTLFHQKKNCKLIKIYGRFPIRNKYLNRENTEEEIDYIDETSNNYISCINT